MAKVTVTEKERKKFEEWHLRIIGWFPNSRSTAPGNANHYEHPFTQGAWTLWQSIYIGNMGKTA